MIRQSSVVQERNALIENLMFYCYSAVIKLFNSSKSVLVKLILFLLPNSMFVMMLSGKSIDKVPPSMRPLMKPRSNSL